MADEKKRNKLVNRKQLTTTLDKELLEEMRSLSESSRIALSKLFDEAMEDLLKKYQHGRFENK